MESKWKINKKIIEKAKEYMAETTEDILPEEKQEPENIGSEFGMVLNASLDYFSGIREDGDK